MLIEGNDAGEKVSTEIVAKGGHARFMRCNLKNENEVVDMVNRAIAEFGQIDILVNNAGMSYKTLSWETLTGVWEEFMSCTPFGIPGRLLRSPLACTRVHGSRIDS